MHLVSQLDWRMIKPFALRVLRQSAKDRILISASSLAFHWFIALVPGAIAIVGMANLAGLPPERLSSLTHGIAVLLPTSAAKAFNQALNTRHSGSSNLSAVVFGGLVSFWASLEAAATLQIALDMAYETTGDRGFIRRRVHGLLIVGVTLVFGGAAFALLIVGGPIGTLIHPGGSSSWFPAIWMAIRWVVGVSCVIVLVSLYDYLGPNRSSQQWRLTSMGGLLSTALWLVVAACYSYYLNNFGHTSQTYGAFAGVVALLLWLFFAGAVILIGAELNRELERTRATSRR